MIFVYSNFRVQLCCMDMFTFCCFLLFIEFFILHTFNELNMKLKKIAKTNALFMLPQSFCLFISFCFVTFYFFTFRVLCARHFFVGYCIACLRRSRDNNRQSTQFLILLLMSIEYIRDRFQLIRMTRISIRFASTMKHIYLRCVCLHSRRKLSK